MAKVSPEELAAIDHIAWDLAKATFEQLGTLSSDVNETLKAQIKHFLEVRKRLIEALSNQVSDYDGELQAF